MTEDTVTTVIKLLTGGGNAALIFLVWFALRAVHAANEAARHIKEIRDAMAPVPTKIEAMAQDMRDVAAQTDSMDSRLARQEIQLAAALSQRYHKAAERAS
jgi:Sec-independent protein translocase protein TatA